MSRTQEELARAVYAALRELASKHLGPAGARMLQIDPTDIANETFLKLSAAGVFDNTEKDMEAYLPIAAKSLRHVLVDLVRKHNALKRGQDRTHVTLTGQAARESGRAVDLLALDEALTKLEARSERQARTIELRFFAGLSVDETASALGVSPRTVDGDWKMAQAWLRVELGG